MERTARRERTKQALLQAAMVEFAARGYTAAVLEHVAARVGVAKGMVYFYFPTKAELARQVSEAWTEMWTEEVARSTARGLDLRELESFMVRLTEQLQQDPLGRAMIRLAQERVHITEELPSPTDAWHTVIRAACTPRERPGSCAKASMLTRWPGSSPPASSACTIS